MVAIGVVAIGVVAIGGGCYRGGCYRGGCYRSLYCTEVPTIQKLPYFASNLSA